MQLISGLLVTTEAMIADKLEEKDASVGGILEEWVVWEVWWYGYVIPINLKTKIQKGQFLLPFFFIFKIILIALNYKGKNV